MTVLFVDLAGYTRLASELDAEEVHGLLDRFFARADRIVEAYGGSVDKHIGDCVMAVFGAPLAHGNDPERAARAALAIRDAVPALGEELGRPIGVHIGIASGQVVASGTGSDAHRQYTVTGDSVNLAARLTDRAQSGEILISDAVRRLLPERFACVELPAAEVKGLAAPVAAWRLSGVTEAGPPPRRPFVGRRAELAQFRGVLEACRESGAGQTVYLRGSAGIGKTRLIEEFRRQAEALGFAGHVGLVLDFGTGAGQDAIGALVRSLLDVLERQRPRGGARGRRAGGRRGPDRRRGAGSTSTICSICPSRSSCGRSTTRWTIRAASAAGSRRSPSWCAMRAPAGRACSWSRTCTGPIARRSSSWPASPGRSRACRRSWS